MCECIWGKRKSRVEIRVPFSEWFRQLQIAMPHWCDVHSQIDLDITRMDVIINGLRVRSQKKLFHLMGFGTRIKTMRLFTQHAFASGYKEIVLLASGGNTMSVITKHVHTRPSIALTGRRYHLQASYVLNQPMLNPPRSVLIRYCGSFRIDGTYITHTYTF